MKRKISVFISVLLAFVLCLGLLPCYAEGTAKELPEPPDIDINSWEFLYAGTYKGVSRYNPEDLRTTDGGVLMDTRISKITEELLNAARAEGYKVWICSGHENFEYSFNWYKEFMLDYDNSSYETAKHHFPPGCSEHSTGLCIDITDETKYICNYEQQHDPDILESDVWKWMTEHCQEYGFIVRYPEDKADYYGMACPHGHLRYVGVEAATYIMENDLCLEEFLELYGVKYRPETAE